MSNGGDTQLREQLLDRRRRLQAAISQPEDHERFERLLQEVDMALERLANNTYGICETCDEPIEYERLAVDPLIRNCLDHLTQAEQRMLEKDLDLAFQIQNTLLPKQGLTVGEWGTAYHYEPAGPVSGDYIDMIVSQDEGGSLLFLLGDVSGKGVAASMLMTNLHAIFRSLVHASPTVSQLVERANRLFCEGTMLTHFATLVCGMARESGEIEICNAGHCFPLLVRGDHIERLPSTGLPLGAFCTGQFSTERVMLAPGDSLFLYSDGLSEARNTSNIQFGEERLSSLISEIRADSPQEMIDICLNNLKRFQSGAPTTDDLTMLIVQRMG